ncbi:MAG: hypothetical protein WCA20_16265, partial [Candidatus Sulfotelmatobacter sp.]
PIVVGHQWGILLAAGSPSVLYHQTEKMSSLIVVWELIYVRLLNALQATSFIEFGQIDFLANISCLYHVYVRGEAYLAAGQGKEAADEFQKIIDHSGIVWNCWTGALAHLGVARANALQARTSQGADADLARTRALAAYNDFFTLWKDADPDIPILIVI